MKTIDEFVSLSGVLIRLQEDESLTKRTDAVRDAVWARNSAPTIAPAFHWYLVDVFRDSVIVRQGSTLLQVPYTYSTDGVVFGDPIPVEAEYVPVDIHTDTVQEAQLVEATQGVSEDDVGLEWNVVIMEAGLSLNNIFYPPEVLREALPLFENVHVYYFDDVASGHKRNLVEKTPARLAGWIDTVTIGANGSVVGKLHFLKEGAARELRSNFVHAWRSGKKDLFGLSIDGRGLAKPAQVDGRAVNWVSKMLAIPSVDVVLRPAAGGRFTELVASVDPARNPDPQEDRMSDKTKRLLRILESRRPEALTGIDRNTVTFVQLAELANENELQEAFAPAAASTSTTTQETQGAPNTGSSTTASTTGGEEVLRRVELAESRALLREQLAGSNLPAVAQARLRNRLNDQVMTEQQIQEAINDERNYLGQIAPARVAGLGGERGGAGVSVGAERIDRLQAAFDRAMGLEPENADLRTIAPISLRQLYNEVTLGQDPNVSGQLQASAVSLMMQEAFTNATLSQVVANSMGRRMVRDYNEIDYAERRIISVTSATDFRERRAVRVGYFGDIAVVNPEAGDYAEIAAYGEESAPYSVGQRGNIVTITRKHIINDDIGAVAKVIGRLGRAARRTFAKFVWDFFKTNPLIYDGVAWFAAGHNNLGAVALSIAALNAAEVAMYNQTELSSGEKLGLKPKFLVIPKELEAAAVAINKSQFLPGSANNDANPWYHRFGANNENIIVLPFLTDANDWGLFADPADIDIIEVAFLNGQETPELFTADSPTVGQMFVADKLQYKIRHEYGGAVVDHRGAYKAVVA